MSFVVGVAPHAGAWIETLPFLTVQQTSIVAPHAGAWIETIKAKTSNCLSWVAPHAGAWIETGTININVDGAASRSPRGSVD